MAQCGCYIDELYLEADPSIKSRIIVHCPLHQAARDLLAALKRFVHPNGKWDGVYYLSQTSRSPVLSCRHCNGYSTDDNRREIDQFIHDESCAILEARRAIAAATSISVQQGAHEATPPPGDALT